MNAKEVSKLADMLGRIKADIADLTQREADIKAALLKEGISEGDGFDYRFTLTSSERDVVDYKAIVAALKPSRQLMTAHTKRVPFAVLRVSARKAVAA